MRRGFFFLELLETIIFINRYVCMYVSINNAIKQKTKKKGPVPRRGLAGRGGREKLTA